ncbi:MAG: ComF family protein [Patescibacteria group bacterium]|jgi:ComF family protein|nr:ComF family protein [Patescibacteria group bacterium]
MWQKVIDLLFPVECLGCTKIGQWLCDDCLNNIAIAEKNFLAEEKFRPLTGLIVALDYHQPLFAKALHCYKYNYIKDLGECLAPFLIKAISRVYLAKKLKGFDLIIPMPLARQRLVWRGFNQSEILARLVSKEFDWPLADNVIARKHRRQPQVGLGATARIENVKGVFKIRVPFVLTDKRILLIDDVLTTGATLTECARILKSAGAAEVWAAVLARD